MNQAVMRPVPQAAHTLAMLSAIGLALAMLINITCIIYPTIPTTLLGNGAYTVALPQFATIGMCAIALLSLPLLILAIHNINCKQISAPSAKMCALLFGLFLLLTMGDGIVQTLISAAVSKTAGSDVLVTLSCVRTVFSWTAPIATVAYVLLGCSVAIITYTATLQSNFPTE